jgi:diguanylate cyclase (GGDEF)-like protein
MKPRKGPATRRAPAKPSKWDGKERRIAPRTSPLTGGASAELSDLIATLHETGRRLEDLTAGEVDAVADPEGGTFMLRRAQDRLRLSDAANKAAVLNALPAHIALIDTRGLIVSVNEAWQQSPCADAIQGPGHRVGLNYLDICDGASGEGSAAAHQVAAGVRSVLESAAKSFSLEYSCHSPAEQRWLLMTATPLSHDRRNGAVVMHLDITQRKVAEIRIRRLNRVYAVLSGINTLIVRVRDRDELFREACRIAVEEGKFPFAWVGLLDPVTQDVTPAAWAGESSAELTTAKSSARDDVPAGKGAVGRAIRGRRPVFNNDLAKHGFGGPRLKEILKLDFRSQITLPLYVDQAVAGTLTMYAHEPDFFDEEELKLLTELAGDISFALENIAKQHKFDKMARIRAVSGEINAAIARAGDRQALLDAACRIAVEQAGFPLAWIGMLDPATRDLKAAAMAGTILEYGKLLHPSVRDDIPGGHGTNGRAFRERKPIVDNDMLANPGIGAAREKGIECGVRSALSLPLLVEGAPVGVLGLYANDKDYFDEGEVSLLTEVASNVSFALEHIAKEEKIARLSRIEAVMGGINALIVRLPARDELFRGACRIAVEQGQLGSAWIGSLDPVTLDITPVAWAGAGSEDMRTAVSTARDEPPRGQGAVSQVVRERRVVVDNDMSLQSFRGPRRAGMLKLGLHSLIALPLYEGDALVGTLSLCAREPGFFDKGEIAMLTELAGNVSFALEHLRRQQKLDKLARIRAVSSEINASIVRIHDREALLRETCRIAVEHGKFELVWIGTVDAAKQQILPVAWHGFSTEIAERVNWTSSRTAGGTLGEAVRTAKPTVRNDIETEMTSGGMRAEALKRGCLSTVCMPLVVDGEVVALVAIFAAGKGFFDENELILLNEVAADVSFALEAIEKQKKLEYLSYYDVLTGLPNRTLFHETLRKTLALASGKGWLVAVLYLDLDNFKNVNDTLGHASGDELLIQFAGRLLQCVRIRDTVGRLGGDEFALILLMEDGQEGAARVATKVREALSIPFDLKGHTVTVTASIGITIHPDDASDPETLMKYADTAMYRAKQAGRDTFRFFTAQMNSDVVARLDMETALRKAVENDEFVLHYQPKVQLDNGRISGVEALLRWQRPGHGLVPPNQFIPILEETGLIVRVGSWVIATACGQIAQWMRTPIGPVQISVNVSGRQFIEGDLHGDVVKALGDSGIAPDLLELELTESSLMANTGLTVASLQSLEKLGVQLSIDDFGTGYSSLAYLSRFPVHKLKIDIAFIRDVTSNPDHAAIVLAIIRMAHGLKLGVIAEGVETAAQLVYLRRHLCDAIQGYYFSRPLPLPELEKMLLEKKCLPAIEAESGRPVKTLLLVDDDAGILALLQRMLGNERYHILSARSAAEGFELLALHPVQVILCDQRMDPMTGTVFLDRVKDLYPDTFRIILSAYTDTEVLMDAINRGAIHRFYTKPWDDRVLRENILEAFRRYWLLHDARVWQQSRDPGDTLPPRRIAAPRV